MKPGRIRDLPSFQKTLNEIDSLERLRRAMPILRPVLRLLGSGAKVDQALADLQPLAAQVRDFVELPDRFNDAFSLRGWIMYELMSLEVAKQALALADAGDIDGGEQVLIRYYDEPTVRRHLIWMRGVSAFTPRTDLAEKALADYSAERYHACVPVVLLLLDGIVNTVARQERGFFAKDADLEAWDSIGGHSSGLARLSKLLGASRTKTTVEPLTLPYRHGILHGMDLGYANKAVAAKAWAALFASRDWAIKVEKGLKDEQPPKPKKTWREIAWQIRDSAQNKRLLDSWKPRSVRIGAEVPASGPPSDYEEGTPERRLAEFLAAWQTANYGAMATCVPTNLLTQGHTPAKVAGELRRHYDDRRLLAFVLLAVEDEAPAITEIRAALSVDESSARREIEQTFRMLCHDDNGMVAPRGKPGTRWVVMPYMI